MKSLYDLNQSFEENFSYGPFFESELPTLPAVQAAETFLGQKINSRFGVSACPLTANARAVQLMSRLSYDLITYKSVRSIEWRGNPAPHWRYVDRAAQLTPESKDESVVGSSDSPGNSEPSMANSFGIHSVKPEYWQADVALATQALSPGQIMMLSLMFTPRPEKSLLEDGQAVAALAAATPVEIFEVNLSHPNTAGGKMMIYEDIELAYQVAVTMKEQLGNKHLLAKVGYFADPALLEQFMKRTAGVVSGVVTMNTFAMKVTSAEGGEVFPGRPVAGVSGAALRTLAMNQAKTCVDVKQKLGLKDYVVVGVGGVTQPAHIQAYLDLGVDAVQSAVGVWADPYLAATYKGVKV